MVGTKKGTAQFYREQAIQLAALAAECTDLLVRLNLLEIAAAFQRLADRAAMPDSLRAKLV